MRRRCSKVTAEAGLRLQHWRWRRKAATGGRAGDRTLAAQTSRAVAIRMASVSTIVAVHRLSNCLPIRDAPQTLGLLLDGEEIGLPALDDLLHRRRQGREVLLLAVIEKDGVVIPQKSVLDLDLDGQEMGQNRENGRDQLWQMLTEMFICGVVFLWRESAKHASFSMGRTIPLSLWPDPSLPSQGLHRRGLTASSSSENCRLGPGSVQSPARDELAAGCLIHTALRTFLSSRFLMVFFIGARRSFACWAGRIIRSSTALTSTSRSLCKSSYSSWSLLVLDRVSGGVGTPGRLDAGSDEPMMGAYRPSNSCMRRL